MGKVPRFGYFTNWIAIGGYAHRDMKMLRFLKSKIFRDWLNARMPGQLDQLVAEVGAILGLLPNHPRFTGRPFRRLN
jgi:hypothetical protein